MAIITIALKHPNDSAVEVKDTFSRYIPFRTFYLDSNKEEKS